MAHHDRRYEVTRTHARVMPPGVAAAMERVAPFVLFTVAFLYFSFSRNLTLDLTDEGQIVYPSWLVAMGAVPHRDFRHIYGPSLFLLNGTLFSFFGTDLAVLRWSLVLIKAAVATAVFLTSRMITSAPFALLAYGICVSVWGTPWWVFNAPYANHYGLLLIMSGLLLFLALRRRIMLASLVAGTCFGLATTFKPTSGMFAFLALALFLIWETPAAVQPTVSSSFLERAARGVRLLALVAAALVSIVYLSRRDTAWNAGMLFAPLGLTLILLGWREVRGSVEPSAGVRSAVGMLCAGAGMALPLLGYVAYYLIVGGLSSVASDLLVELPSHFQWFSPLGTPERRPTLVAIVIVGSMAAIRLWRGSPGRRRMLALVAAAAATGSAAYLVRETVAAPGVRAYAFMMFWHRDIIPLAYLIPFLVVWTTAKPVLMDSGRRRASTGVGLLYFFGVTSLLLLYPAADFWHAVMGLPAFLPLLAFQLHRTAAPFRSPGGGVAAMLVFAVTLAFSVPFVETLRYVIRTQPPSPGVLTRATGVASSSSKFADTVQLMAYLDAQPKDVPLFTLANQQMLYFLSGRTSAASADEFVLYLVAIDTIAADDARALVSQERIIERLQVTKPLIIDDSEGEMAGRFRRVFPAVSAFVATRYRPAHTAGTLRVLRWADA